MKLGSRHSKLLDSICRSNGGGVYVRIDSDKVAQSLERLGLIQITAGDHSRAIHTAAGLKLWRASERSCSVRNVHYDQSNDRMLILTVLLASFQNLVMPNVKYFVQSADCIIECSRARYEWLLDNSEFIGLL